MDGSKDKDFIKHQLSLRYTKMKSNSLKTDNDRHNTKKQHPNWRLNNIKALVHWYKSRDIMGLPLDSRLFTIKEMKRSREVLDMQNDTQPDISIHKTDIFKPNNLV